MAVAKSRLTAQGQISIPVEVRRKLGIGPGSIIEWEEQSGEIVVRKAGQFSIAQTRAALGFGAPPKRRSSQELKEGIRQRMRKRHASR
jgi:AbrB family looped-hinge helix DNA binding protein